MQMSQMELVLTLVFASVAIYAVVQAVQQL